MKPVNLNDIDLNKLNILFDDIYKKFSSLNVNIYDFVREKSLIDQTIASVDSDEVSTSIGEHENDYDHTKLHDRSHDIDSSNDHSSTITTNHLLVADLNGLPSESGVTVVGTDVENVGTFKAGDGGTTNYFEIEPDGTIKFNGNATVYDDLQVSISNIRIPTSNAPTERLYAFGIGGGVTFPVLGFDLNEYMYFDVQTSHSMRLNTILDNHIHFTLPNTTNIGDKFQFQLDVIAAGIGTQWAAPTGTPFTAEHTIVANDDTYHRVLELADIPASNDTVSSIYKFKLTRIAASSDEYGSEVYISFTDCHYEKDTVGSRSESSK